MKKYFKKLFAFCMLFPLAVTASAQVDLNSILGNVLGTSGNSSADMISSLTSIFSSNKQAPANKIVGTWTYAEPAIVFQSDNLLAKAGASIASDKLEKKLQEQLTKYGIKPGSMEVTFNEDGSFTEKIGSKTVKGTWEVGNDSKLVLKIAKTQNVAVTTQISGKNMQVVTDATKLLNLFKTLGSASANSNIQTITSLMKSVNGMQAGLTLKKQ